MLTAKGIVNILCDYEMGVMDGIELAVKLLITEQRRDIRFVLFSGTPMRKITTALVAAGVDIPIIPKTKLRESWIQPAIISAWFPELAASLHPQ